CYFKGNVARSINKELERHGKFFAREYDDVIVFGEQEFINRYTYILCNAVKAGLVERADEWTGWSSLEGALGEKSYRFELLNATKYYNAVRFGKKVNKADFIETWEFDLTVPPMWEAMTSKQRAQIIWEVVSTAEKKYKLKREGKPVLGIANIKRQNPTDRPKSPSKKTKIKFICFEKAMLKELLEGYRQFNGGYRETLGTFYRAAHRKKRPLVEWPMGSYPPSGIRPIGYDLAA
ncbi:MAG: hypothetical protein GY847_03435, partial [Proteobacteria bacterium]|nr:hypothetical protein [Pseudomonadota bacterium]